MTTKKKITVKPKHWLIMISACLLIFMVKMCELDDFGIHRKTEKIDMVELEQIKDDTDSLLTVVIDGIKERENKYNNELDSLKNLVFSGELSKEEKKELERVIKNTEKLLREERLKMGGVDSEIRDSIVYNISKKDTVIYNIINKDTIVYDTIYQVDTIFISTDTLEFTPIGFGSN